MTMSLEALREALPEYAKDLKLNLQAVLGESTLSPVQQYGTALAVAAATRHGALRQALLSEARTHAGEAAADDALAAAALMGMTNIFYRFRHLVGKEGYAQLPARLRMNRVAKPAGPKLDFELFCLAVSAVNGCEACVRAHEKTLTEGGFTEAQIHDAIRIAATVHGVASALNADSGA
jgi:alkyl hydroperoxide reductase subunit D